MFSVRGAENICNEILYLILAEKLFTLPAANEMLPLSALFTGREVGIAAGIQSIAAKHYPRLRRFSAAIFCAELAAQASF